MTETTLLDVNLIRTDGGTQSRAALDKATVSEYKDAMVDGAEFPPVIVYYDGADYWLADGFHRVAAAADAEFLQIDAEIRQGTQRDAVLHSVGANATHGLRRTNADKRRAIETLLRDSEWAQWSNREIARRSGVNDKTVASVRSALSAEFPQIDQPDSITVSRGGVTFQQKVNRSLRKGDRVSFPDGRRGIVQSIYDNGIFAAVLVDGKEENTLTTNLTKVVPVKLPFGEGETLIFGGKVVVANEINEAENYVTFLGDENLTVSLEAAMNARPINSDVIEFNPDDQWDNLPEDDAQPVSEVSNCAFKFEDIVILQNYKGGQHDFDGLVAIITDVNEAFQEASVITLEEHHQLTPKFWQMVSANKDYADVWRDKFLYGLEHNPMHKNRLPEEWHQYLPTEPINESASGEIPHAATPEPSRLEIKASVISKKHKLFGTASVGLDHDLPLEVQDYLDKYDLRRVSSVRLVLEVIETEVQP